VIDGPGRAVVAAPAGVTAKAVGMAVAASAMLAFFVRIRFSLT
jgi:hypothetical protein